MKDLARQILQAIRGRCSDERGVALIVAAGSMVALTSAVALAVDVGMLTVARTQAQTAADGAALAGAAMLIQTPDNAGRARLRAIEYAGFNAIQGDGALVRDEDVVVDLGARTVGVQVLRTEERGNPMGTFFARIFGVTSVDITAYAKARASYAGGINCLLPLAVPDQWEEAGGAGNPPDEYNPELGDRYVPWMDASTDPPTYNNDDYTGYSDADVGKEIVLTLNDGGGIIHPGWYNAWRPPGQSGAADYRENIRGCVDPSISFSVGQTVYTEQGNMSGPTGDGFRDLVNLDPEAAWNEGMQCVTDRAYADPSIDAPEHCRDSPRIRPIPMFDPNHPPELGHNPFQLTNFAAVFVEEVKKVNGDDYFVARWIGYQGLDPVEELGEAAGPQFKVVQLIQ